MVMKPGDNGNGDNRLTQTKELVGKSEVFVDSVEKYKDKFNELLVS